jgi:chromosome segregation ATPase
MPVNGKPGIGAVREAPRDVRNAIDAIRARLEALEKLLNTTELTAGNAFAKLNTSNASISFLQSQINSLNADLDALDNLINTQANGIVVLSSGALITRTLDEGENITITNPDGVDANPIIGVFAPYPFLTDEFDDDILTNDGHRIRVSE